MRSIKIIIFITLLIIISVCQPGCSFLTYTSNSTASNTDSSETGPEPNYNVTLDFNYQDFTSYLYMGNRIENFTAYFNTFFRANEDYQDAFDEYRASLISYYNRRLDSLGVSIPVSGTVKEKLDKSIERASKIIQFHKYSKYIANAVLIIGKAYFIENDYYKAERTFNEFLSKFTSSVLADEAILYLGRTKVKLGKIDEGEIIFKNLVKNSTDHEIQSLAARDMGIISYNKGKYEEAVEYFKTSIDFSDDKERKAEDQFILAKIESGYKPPLAAQEYKKVLDYTSDYDLSFYARLNYAKGLIYNKDYTNSTAELEALRKKYRDEIAFTQLVDLEMANNLYDQKKIAEANNKYYEVIVKYPNTASSSDAYYYLARNEEEVNNNYLNALVNYKKAVEESSASDYYKESSSKTNTLERYFHLIGEVGDSVKIDIPTANADVEKFRKNYNEEKGISQQNNGSKNGSEQVPPKNGNTGNDGTQKGNGKGKPGGFKSFHFEIHRDSTKEAPPPSNPSGPSGPSGPNANQEQRQDNYNKRKKQKEVQDSLKSVNGDSSKTINNDSLKETEQAKIKEKDENMFNSYYEIAEIFIYSLDRNDSAEYYLKLLLRKFPESYKQAKVMYTLGSFYKNTNRQPEAMSIFNTIVSAYPKTIYADESRKILGMKTSDTEIIRDNPEEKYFGKAITLIDEKKYPEAIQELQQVEIKHPNDSLVAKAFYSIGWIYENKLNNKDSSLVYYKKLKEKYPSSEYAEQVTPLLDYMASIVVKDSTGAAKENNVTGDSTTSVVKESPKEENNPPEVVNGEKKENSEEVTTDTTNVKEGKLSQEEIDKLLKEGDQDGK